jgi:hypothetical protein
MSPSIKFHAQTVSETLLSEISGSHAVVIATVDGFDLAHAGQRRVDPARLAAIVSSLVALGNAASNETAIGTPQCLVIESSEGRLVARCMYVKGDALIVVWLTDKTVLLGMVWNRIAAAEKMLNQLT